MNNCSNIGGKIFASDICQKCGIYWQKTCCWCLTNFKFGTQANYLMPRKKLKITFLSGARNIVKMGSEIYKYFLLFFIISKYFMFVLRPVFNSSPQFYSHPACRLLELQLTFCKFSCCSRLCSTRTQILFKSETAQLAISKYFCLK